MKTDSKEYAQLMTKREHMATQILSATATVGLSEYEMAKLAMNAVRQTDYLIMALNSDES